MMGGLQPFCLGTESEEIIILFLAEKRSVQPGLDASYQKVPKVPSRLTTAATPQRFLGCFAASPLARRFVYPKLTLNQETRQLLFALCSVYLFF